MKELGKLSWLGTVKFRVYDLATGEEEVLELKNLITDAGLNLVRNALYDGTNPQITYVAVGTSTTAVSNGQTQLVAESFRKIMTTRALPGTGQLLNTVYISPSEANVNIREVGWFAGVGATGTANSGVMFARILYSLDKTSTKSLTVERTDTIARA